MGAFITGLIGRAEQQRDKEEAREFQEAKQERDRKRQLVDLAAQQAIQTGQYQALPAVFGELDELGPPPGTPKGMKDPYKQLGIKLAQMIGLKRKQAQQQRQAQQADQQYQQVTGQPPPGAAGPVQTPPMPPPSAPVATAQQAQPNLRQFDPALMQAQAAQPNGGQPAQPQTAPRAPQQGVPPMRPPMQALVEQLQQGRKDLQAEAEAQGEKTFQTERTRGGIRAQDTEKQLEDRASTFSNYLQTTRGMSKKEADEEADHVVFNKAAKPPALRRVANASSDQFPELGIKGKTGTVFIDPSTSKAVEFVETARGGQSLLDQWTKIYMAKNPRLTPEQAAQQAGAMLVETKQILPEERIDLQRNTVRTIMGETGLLRAPTHVGPGTPQSSAVPFPNITTQPIPAPSAPVRRATPGGQPSAGVAPAPAAEQEQWRPQITGAERPRKDNAEVIMTLGAKALPLISQVAQAHPEWTGATGPTWQMVQKKFGTADPSLGTVEGALEGLRGFLPSLHGFRSGKVLDSWKATLDNPLRNPALTQNVIREIGKAAKELRDVILRRSTAPMSMEEEERKAGGGDQGVTKEEQEYMDAHGIK